METNNITLKGRIYVPHLLDVMFLTPERYKK